VRKEDSILKYVKNIKLLIFAGLLLQVGTGFAYDSDWQEQGQGQRILENIKHFNRIPADNWEPTGPTLEDIRLQTIR